MLDFLVPALSIILYNKFLSDFFKTQLFGSGINSLTKYLESNLAFLLIKLLNLNLELEELLIEN